MGAHRNRGRRGWAKLAVVVVIVASALVSVPTAAHAASCGDPSCGIGAVDDTYTFDYSASAATTYTKPAAEGLLANDFGPPTSTRVDLQDTVDDFATQPHVLTTDMGYTVQLYGDGHFTYKTDGTFSGDDSFLYYMFDLNDTTTTDFAFVTITVRPVLGPTTFVASGTLSAPQPGVLTNAAGVDPNTLTMDSTSAAGGTIEDDGFGAFTYTPPPGTPPAIDTFKYNVLDITDTNAYDGLVSITTDSIAPIVAMNSPTANVMLSSTITVKWSGADTGGSGLSHYNVDVRQSTSTGVYGAWTPFRSNTLTKSATYTGALGASYCFRVQAVDGAANTSPWVTRCTSVPLKATSLSYSSGWSTKTSTAFFGGSARQTSTQNATASRSNVYAKHVWLIVSKSSGSGTLQVLWNNVVKANVNLANATTVHKQVVAALSFSSVQKGTLKLKVTSSNKTVTLEGLDVFLS